MEIQQLLQPLFQYLVTLTVNLFSKYLRGMSHLPAHCWCLFLSLCTSEGSISSAPSHQVAAESCKTPLSFPFPAQTLQPFLLGPVLHS